MINKIEAEERSERQRLMIDDAAALATDVSEGSELIGYIVLSFYSDGSSRSAGHRPYPAEHRIGEAMFRAWAKQVLSDHISYGEGVTAAHNVLDGKA